MAPKPMTSRTEKDVKINEKFKFKVLDDDTDAWSDIMDIYIDATKMSAMQIKAIGLENQRRKRVRRISYAIRTLNEKRLEIKLRTLKQIWQIIYRILPFWIRNQRLRSPFNPNSFNFSFLGRIHAL